MTLAVTQESYKRKPSEYFRNVRPEILEFVPLDCKRALDVGCADGSFAESLKKARGIEVYGVEPVRSVAKMASKRLDCVIEGFFGPELDIPLRYFDCIFFNDVLEHMVDPEAALRHARNLLRPGGVVVASIPNIGYLPIVRDLIFRDRWQYVESGIMDRTHLRFFTKSSIRTMFEREGFSILKITGIKPYSYQGSSIVYCLMWSMFRTINALLRNRFERMTFLQFAVVAKPNRIILEERSTPVEEARAL